MRRLPLMVAASLLAACTGERGDLVLPDPPRAVRDSAATFVGTPVVVGVAANDSAPTGWVVRVVTVGTPAHGRATVAPGDSGIRYEPAPGFVGWDSVPYRLGLTGVTRPGQPTRDSAMLVLHVRPGPYQVTVLDRGPGLLGFEAGLNARGDVVATLRVDRTTGYPVVWPAGSTTPIRLPGVTWGRAVDVDDRGQVLGHGVPTAGGCSRPLLWRSITDAPVSLDSAGSGCQRVPVALGEDGTVVSREAVWRGGRWVPTFGERNSAGRQFGYAYAVTGAGGAVLQGLESYSTSYVWRGDVLTALPGIGGRYVRAEAASSAGHVAGYAERMGEPRGSRLFVWKDGAMTVIEGPYSSPSEVTGVNASGDAVFEEYRTVPNSFVRDENGMWVVVRGVPFPLQPLVADQTVKIVRLHDINDRGVIAAMATRNGGADTVTVRLTPPQ